MKTSRPTRLARILLVALLSVLPIVGGAKVQAQIIYDAALDTLPDSQGWWYLTNPLFNANTTRSVSGGLLTVDSTTVRTEAAGFFNNSHPIRPTLDRNEGFALGWTFRMLEEIHVSSHRAGFSIIVLDQFNRGIELGFWEDSIWAQDDDPLFIKAESSAFDTTADLARYWLAMVGDTWTLTVDGQIILTGPVRDYSAFTGFPNPYVQQDFVFFGDNTSSASAKWQMGRMAWYEAGDFDFDGVVDADDLDELGRAIAGEVEGWIYDLDGDGTVDYDDARWLLEHILNTRPGDVNLDGKVDDFDLAVLQANLGQPGGWADGAVGLQGRLDLRSAFLLFEHYGYEQSTHTTIPEPGAAVMIVAIGWLGFRRSQRES
ncbi:MAG: hypothetical protein JJU36_03965 [Phycisphaeraceae bacterium]|nr:hypothetical protein [Phycisphaeraceae bacterium]